MSAWVGPGRAGRGRLHHVDRPPLRPPRRAAATCCRPRSRPPATSACASTPPGGRCRCRRRTAACRPTRWSRTTTPSSPPARRRSPATTTRAPGAMVRVALAPCSPFSVTPDLMRAHRRAGRAPRRAPAHPPGRGPRRGHVLPRDVRPPPDRALRGLRLGVRPVVGRPLHLPRRRRDRPHGRLGHRRRPLPQLEHDDRRRRHRPGGRLPGGGRARRPGLRRLGVDRLRLAVARGPGRAAARPPAGRARRRSPRGTPSSSAPAGRPRASAGSASWACWPRARPPTWWRGSSTAWRSPGALTDPVEALLRCGPTQAFHTVIAGRPLVEDGELRVTGLSDVLARHRRPPPVSRAWSCRSARVLCSETVAGQPDRRTEPGQASPGPVRRLGDHRP